MPKKSRRSRNFAAIRIDETLLVGALAAEDLISSTMVTFGNEAYLISADLTWAWSGQQSNSQGPIVVGVAHGDYSATEIEEWIEAIGSADPNDKIAQEQSRRLCRMAGTLPGNLDFVSVLNDGNVTRLKLKFKVQDAGTLQAFAYNTGSATITTGSALVITGKLFLNWQ